MMMIVIRGVKLDNEYWYEQVEGKVTILWNLQVHL